jgi:hypothetical protein
MLGFTTVAPTFGTAKGVIVELAARVGDIVCADTFDNIDCDMPSPCAVVAVAAVTA